MVEDEMDAETMRLMLDQVLKENQQLKAEIADVRTSKKSMKKLQLLPDLDLRLGDAVPAHAVRRVGDGAVAAHSPRRQQAATGTAPTAPVA